MARSTFISPSGTVVGRHSVCRFSVVLLVSGLLVTGLAQDVSSQASDLICAPEDPNDCYPSVFQATDEFQSVRPNQHLPQGLHVRLNIYTGEKEAKINVPDSLDPALADLPIDRAVVVVDSPHNEADDRGQDASLSRVASRVKPSAHAEIPPRPSLEVLFRTLGLAGNPLEDSLAALLDMSNDVYYGLKIAEDTSAVTALLCMMSDSSVLNEHPSPDRQSQARLAASIVGASLQNNHKALEEFEKSWTGISSAQCDGGASDDTKLQDRIFSMLFATKAEDEKDMSPIISAVTLLNPKISALRGLLQSHIIRQAFAEGQGLLHALIFLGIDTAGDDSQAVENAKTRLATVLTDTFLDEDFGATPDMWPLGQSGKALDDRLRALAKQHKGMKGHWSADLVSRREAYLRTAKKSGRGRDEL